MNIDKKALIGIITEIEASRERAKGETRHQSEILKKAKEQNFDTKAIRKVLQRRAMSEGDRESLDIAIDTYERAMGSLAHAQEAVDEGRMSAREAAEHYSVPRGALAAVTRGAKNGISEPSSKPEDGDDGITGGEDGKAEADDDAARGVGSREDQGQQQWESRLADGRSVQHEETRDGADAGGGTQRLQHGVRSPAEGADPVRLRDEAPTTPSVGAVAAEPRVAPPFLGEDPGPTLDFLRGPSPANRRVA
jgi:uncharacterized protein (UPF0335 family)